MQIIRFDALAPSRWANGGGVTREVAAQRDADGLLWRVSLAEVAADGPFSAYPGLLRILTVVSGNGMKLVTPAGIMVALPLSPVRFAGGLPVEGRLLDGPIRDLNVMLRDGLYRGEVAVLGQAADMPGALQILTVVSGRAQIGDAALAAGDTVIAPEGAIMPAAGAVILDVRIIPET